MPRKKIDALLSTQKAFGAKGLAYLVTMRTVPTKCSFSGFMKPEELDALVAARAVSRAIWFACSQLGDKGI